MKCIDEWQRKNVMRGVNIERGKRGGKESEILEEMWN